MTNTHQRPWLRGRLEICNALNLPSFESIEAVKAYFARYCGSTQSLTRIGRCQSCNGWHFESHEVDEAGKRPMTLRLPANAIISGKRLSAQDTKTYASIPANTR